MKAVQSNSARNSKPSGGMSSAPSMMKWLQMKLAGKADRVEMEAHLQAMQDLARQEQLPLIVEQVDKALKLLSQSASVKAFVAKAEAAGL